MLVVANGHNEEAKWPDPPYPGEFDGRQLHALDYAEADEFRGQNVLVVGMGNSAMDIATDISLVADRTYLSARHGTWVIPKRLLGKPADQIIKPWVAVHVPWRIRQPLSQFLLRLTVGPPERYGLPAPSRGLFQDHPTITDTVLSRISHGELTPKPGIDVARARRGRVHGRQRGAGRRDRLVHGLPRLDAVPRGVADRAGSRRSCRSTSGSSTSTARTSSSSA